MIHIPYRNIYMIAQLIIDNRILELYLGGRPTRITFSKNNCYINSLSLPNELKSRSKSIKSTLISFNGWECKRIKILLYRICSTRVVRAHKIISIHSDHVFFHIYSKAHKV